MRQQTAAELLAQAMEPMKDLPHTYIQRKVGLGNGALAEWLASKRSPRSDLFIATCNACGYRVVLEPMHGEGG